MSRPDRNRDCRTLIAGIGNIFLGDDSFGVELAALLGREELPEGVQVADYGIAGMHLAYDLLEIAPETTILLDAIPRGDDPGTLYLLEIGRDDIPAADEANVEAHGMQPDAVLALLRNLGGSPGRIMLVGCEPATTEEHMGLSEPVAAALDRAVVMVKDLLEDNGKDGGGHVAPEAVSAGIDRAGVPGGTDARGDRAVSQDR
ncbi:MAG: hydrogenase maturation protease [Pseudonocardiaceae bacterium]|nr:hydrogenase maturation protease [Pseudonocardiaceae bacterium]